MVEGDGNWYKCFFFFLKAGNHSHYFFEFVFICYLYYLKSSGHHVDPMLVLESGASGVSERFDSDTLVVILEAYMAELKSTFLLATALAGWHGHHIRMFYWA